LFRHQFASHVCQTLLLKAADVVDRECKGESIVHFPEDDNDSDDDEADKEAKEKQEDPLKNLPTMSEMMGLICEQLDRDWQELIMDRYASHVVRTLLNLLAGNSLSPDTELRTKKNVVYHQNHNMTKVRGMFEYLWPRTILFFKKETAQAKARLVPSSFENLLTAISKSLFKRINADTLQELSVHQVANPVLQVNPKGRYQMYHTDNIL
jgi:hypothetical protein